jgi:hypothetical protein
MKAEHTLADFDSAPAMLRALGAYLHGRDFPGLGIWPAALEPLARLLNRLPRPLRELVYRYSGWAEAIPAARLAHVEAEALSQWAVDRYPPRRYPAVAIGSSNGAAVHLWAALGIPWLPQTLLIPVRAGLDPDDPRRSLDWGRVHGPALLTANPDLQLHHMHDANQDRLMIQSMQYFRVKRRRLGATFERFLDAALAPGATVFLVECGLTWPTTRIGDRHVFQHGALGGATEEEYARGGPRVEAYLRRYGVDKPRWDPPPADGRSPEAEWGFEPALRADVERLARRRGWRVRRVVFMQPEDLSPLVAELYRWWYRARGIDSHRLLVESFVLLEPWWTLRSGAAPFWMVFNKQPSLDAVEAYLARTDPFNEIALTLFSHGVDSVGLPSIERWAAVPGRARTAGRFVGVDRVAFPRDFAVFLRFHRDLAAAAQRWPMPAPLTLAQLDAFLHAEGHRFAVQWLEDPNVPQVRTA